jgi:predicted enzyme related to lactoylglutathione lyase
MNTGGHIWYELMTSDAAAALNFYGRVVGWKPEAHAAGIAGYTLLSTGSAQIGGVMQIESQLGFAGPTWIGYVCVADVDATASRIQQAGGTICIPGTDIPGGFGRFAMVLDPQGSPLYVMRPGSEASGNAFAAKVGHCQWNELVTSDPDAATDFYTQIFGWTRGEVMPMGPLGNYQFLLNGNERFGAVMKRSRAGAPSLWRYYFGVEDIDRAAQAITEGGGRLMGDPQQVPGGGFAVVALDPQGAEFGVAGPRRN